MVNRNPEMLRQTEVSPILRATSHLGADPLEPLMELAALLAEARDAGPVRRIEWRDRLAGYGERAIDAVKPWLGDPALAAFAIRVIERAGEEGQAEVATKVLRSARKVAPANVQGDLDWALARIKVAMRPAPIPQPSAATLRAGAVSPTRALPRSAGPARRRPR
jgi:hypothetical protein